MLSSVTAVQRLASTPSGRYVRIGVRRDSAMALAGGTLHTTPFSGNSLSRPFATSEIFSGAAPAGPRCRPESQGAARPSVLKIDQ